MVRIIAFSGRKHCGKSTLAELCTRRYGFQMLYFADGLKDLVCEMLCISRETLDQTKDIPQRIQINVPFIERTFNVTGVKSHCDSIRDMLQYIGTDIIRTTNPDWHIQQLARNIRSDKVCIGDCRFPNELDFIRSLGGEAWFIIRPMYTSNVSNHSSEISLRWLDFGRHVLINDSTKQDLIDKWSWYMDTGEWHVNAPSRYDVLGVWETITNPYILEELKRLL